MKRLKKKYFMVWFIILALVANIFPYTAFAEDTIDVNAEAAMIIDAKSGKILYEKNADKLLYPSSMTKMMTEYLTLEAIKEGKVKWDQKISISDYVFKVSHDTSLSNVYLKKDTQYTLKELYESMAIYSANGSAIAIAELIGGSEKDFVKMMNDKAKELGLKDCKFVNATGLNNSDLKGMHAEGTGENDENRMSARSVATLAYRLINDYPEVLETSSIPYKNFREGVPKEEIHMSNWNFMLPGLIFEYKGVDGLKTGYTELGGYSFTGTAKKGDMRLITVVMKSPSINIRFKETKKLLDYGFSHYELKEILPADFKIQGQSEIPVTKGKAKKVEVKTKEPLTILIKKGEEKQYEPFYKLDESMMKDGKVLAPLTEGQSVGHMALKYKGSEKYGYLTNDGESREEVELVTTKEVKKANWLSLFTRGIGEGISKLWKKIFK